MNNCDDAISRAEVKRLVDFYKEQYDGIFLLNESIDKLPSVQPSRKGHWIEEEMYDQDICYRCSECNEVFCLIEGTPELNEYHFCPNCGAKMESEG